MSDTENQQIEDGAAVTLLNKNEKKARKLLKGTGIKKIEGVNRVVLRRRGGTSFVIASPEVYRTPNGSYVVFGEARVQQHDIQQQLQQLAGLQGQGAPAGADDKSPEAINADLEKAVKEIGEGNAAEDVDDADVDTTGLDDDKIEMVMDQANTTKAKAVAALRENDGDLVNALMALTS